MIIKSLTLKNFQCYFGDHVDNAFYFKEGLNLIIGDNASGKSKLFDAFFWVLKDQIFNADERVFVFTRNYKEKLISDKAKRNAQVGAKLNAEVTLIAESSQETLYRLTRIYGARKLDERQWEADSQSKLLVDEDKLGRWVPVRSQLHDSVLRRVISRDVEPYMWFQGEQVDGLMDLTDKSTLTNVINVLSNIQIYDELLTISTEGRGRAEKALRKAQQKVTKDQDRADSIGREIDAITLEIARSETDIEDYRASLETAKDRIEELVNQIDDAAKKTELKKEAERLRAEMIADEASLNKRLSGIYKNLFTKYWILRGSQVSLDRYSDKYKEYFTRHNKALAEATASRVRELPRDIPQPIHVNQMLVKERCFVCGREAKRESEAYKHILNLLSPGDGRSDEHVFANDGSKFFQKLYNNSLELKRTIAGVDESINSEFSLIQQYRGEIKKKENRIKEIRGEFTELLEDDSSENIVSAFRTHEANREKYQELLNRENRKLEAVRVRKIQKVTELDSLVTGAVDELARAEDRIYADLVEVIRSTRNDVFDSLISELEDTANELFSEMTRRNRAITGRIRLKRMATGNYAPEIVDSDGYVIHSTNDSNIILVKLALIMAILMSRGKLSENYSLISDAPTSKMAKNYTVGFYEALSKNFRQSIVMTYDFLEGSSREEFSNFNMGRVYSIASEYPSGDRMDRSDLRVSISEVSL